jgi:hypothetical protein
MTDAIAADVDTGRYLPTQFAMQANFLGAAVIHAAYRSLASDVRAIVGEECESLRISSDLLRIVPGLADLEKPSQEHPTTVLSRAHLGVAATGSVLTAEETPEDRRLHILTRRHVVLLPANRIVAAMSDAAGVLRVLHGIGMRYLTFVSGPSRTADIEKILTIGVHGAHELVVVIVDGWEPDGNPPIS